MRYIDQVVSASESRKGRISFVGSTEDELGDWCDVGVEPSGRAVVGALVTKKILVDDDVRIRDAP
jgi:hypothetical protein